MSSSVGYRHYLIEADDELFVLRLASTTTSPEADDATELEVARAAAAAGVAPEVVTSLPSLACLVTRFAEGRRLEPMDLDDDETLASLVGSVRALHACPTPLTELSSFPDAPTSARGRPLVTSHGNLTRERLVLDGERIWIVDYRWAGVAHPFRDLARLAEDLGLSEERTEAMLELYLGSVDDEALMLVRRMRATADDAFNR